MHSRYRGRRRSPQKRNIGNSNALRPPDRRFGQRGMVLSLLLCISIFSKEPFGANIAGSRVDLFQLLLALYGILQIHRARIAPKVGISLSALFLLSLGLLTVFEYEYSLLLKQGIPAIFIYTGLCSVIEQVNSRDLFIAYRRVCFYAAVFGLAQFLLDLGGISILIKSSGRLDSFSQEPSYFAIAVGPAVYFAVLEMAKTRKLWNTRSLVIVFAFMLTFSVTSIVIALIIGAILIPQKRGPLWGFGILSVLFAIYVNQDLLPQAMQEKFNAFADSTDSKAESGDIRNLSVLSPVSNWAVATDTIGRGRILGNGFGGHSFAYFEYFEGSGFSSVQAFGTNAIGGHSLFIRVVSEFGLLGFFTYIAFIIKGLLLVKSGRQIWWTLLAIVLVGRVVKLGGMFELGLPIFILVPIVFYTAAPGNRDRVRKKRRNLERNYKQNPSLGRADNVSRRNDPDEVRNMERAQF